MSDASSTDIVREITPAERETNAAAFTKAHAAAYALVRRAILAPDHTSNSTPEVTARLHEHQKHLDEILAGVATIGTSEFVESRVLTDPNAIQGFDIRIDWSIMLFAWCRSWAHTAFLDPEATDLDLALEALEDEIVNGMDAEFDWMNVTLKASDDLMAAIFAELREKHELVGGWQVLCYDERASKLFLEAKPPRCNIPFRCEFSMPIVRREDGVYELVSVYNASIEKQASRLEGQAAAMVEEAVQRSLPLRDQAASLRSRMK